MTYDGPLSVLCDTQSIPILLFIGRHGNCIKSNIYRGVSRTSNTPKRLESLAGSGLIEMEPVGDGEDNQGSPHRYGRSCRESASRHRIDSVGTVTR